MVQIERPESAEPDSVLQPEHPRTGKPAAGQVAVGSSSVDSQAITEEAIAAGEVGELPDDSASQHGFEGAEAMAPPEPPTVAPPDWQSDRTKRSRQVALVAAVSIAGFLSAVVVFGWFVKSWRQRQVEVTSTDSSPQSPAAATDGAIDAETAEDSADSSETADDQAIDPEQPPSEQVQEPPVGVALADSEPTQSTGSDTTPQEVPEDLIPQSPVIQPLTNDLNPLAGDDPLATAGGDDNGPPSTGMQDLPASLQQFMPFLVDEGLTDQPTLKAPPTMDEVKIEAAAEDRDGPLIQAPPKELNLKADLGVQLALSTGGYPLTDLMLLVSEITGVPVQIDWVSFDLAGIDIKRQVGATNGWRKGTVRQLLDATAASLGAEIREEPSLIVLTLTDETFQRILEDVSSLDDFGQSKSSAESVINEFMGGDDVDGSRRHRQLFGLAVESLRRMRGVPPKVADQRLIRWAQNMEQSVEWPLLTGGDGLPQFDAPTTVVGYLRRLARKNQATCVINWYDVNRRAVSPEQLVFPGQGTDAATSLTQTLAPFGLQVRSVDAQHWWVGTEPTYDRLTAVVWTPPLGEARDAFSERIHAIMQGASPDVFRFAIDPESDRALLLLPRYIVRQLPKITPAIASK